MQRLGERLFVLRGSFGLARSRAVNAADSASALKHTSDQLQLHQIGRGQQRSRSFRLTHQISKNGTSDGDLCLDDHY